MKNIVLLIILAGALVFSAYWHAKLENSKSPVPTLEDAVNRGKVITRSDLQPEEEWEIPAEEDLEIPVKEDWECTQLTEPQLRCQRVLVTKWGEKYYTQDYKVIENPKHVPKGGETTKPDRFPVCPIHEWTCLRVGNPCTLICQRPTDDPRYGESKIAGCEADTWPDFSPACEI